MGLFSKRQPKTTAGLKEAKGVDVDMQWHQDVPYVDRFGEICDDMIALHNQKGADYGSGTDPYANVRASEEFGVPAWIGALIRMNDKITRLKSFIRQGKLVNESAFDSIRDIAVYAIIMRILYEEQPATTAPKPGFDLDQYVAALQGHSEPQPQEPFPDFNPPADVPVDPDPDHSNEQEHVPEVADMLDQVPQYEPLTTPDPAPSCYCDMDEVKPHEPHMEAINFTDLKFDAEQNPITQKYVILADGGREWI